MSALLRLIAACLALLATHAEAKAVFAHFMVGNTEDYNQALWETEFQLAKASSIDAFVLNIARGEIMNPDQIANAFRAATAQNFNLLFSFDYAGRDAWPAGEVIGLLKAYANHKRYWKHKGLPLVSTFEGFKSRFDWFEIKKAVPCFFVPSWSSVGAEVASYEGYDVIDGLFNWSAWPNHPDWPKDTSIDAAYVNALKRGNKPYMMPVSPWFYTNLPNYDKNWLWRGEMLWFDRWIQTLHVQPEWVQIISWNDYAESHYIGPTRGEKSMIAFKTGGAPFNYALDMNHGPWRSFLPYVADLYRNGTATVSQEGVTVWHRLQSKAAGCFDGRTTSFTATHLQPEGNWDVGMRDGVFFAAQLGSHGTAEVTVGGQVFKPDWRRDPYGGVGIYVGYVLTSATGSVKVDIRRGGKIVATVTSPKLIGDCSEGGYYNFNPTVMIGWGDTIAPKRPPIVINATTPCMQGTGVLGFGDLCSFTCSVANYCPLSACMCTKFGVQPPSSVVRGPSGYPAPGKSIIYKGLCDVACSWKNCLPEYCSMTKSPDVEVSVSPFNPPSCTSGSANPIHTYYSFHRAALEQICAFGCKHGYCPMHICICATKGALSVAQNPTDSKPDFGVEDIDTRLLCRFTCAYGVCPAPLCKNGGLWNKPCTGCPIITPPKPCDYTVAYASLESVANDASALEPDCAAWHGINVLSGMLEASGVEYQALKSGYDKAWPTYEAYIRDGVQGTLDTMMNRDNGKATKFFKCWKYDDGVKESDKGKARECSCSGTDRFWGKGLFRSFWFELVDKEGFDKHLESVGVDPEWVEPGYDSNTGICAPGEVPCNAGVEYLYGWPTRKATIVVENPATIVAKAFEDNTLAATLDGHQLDMSFSSWRGSPTQMLDVLSVPVLMIGDAIENMKEIKVLADKLEANKKKELILLIIESILMVIPIVGQIAGTLGRSGIMAARLLRGIEGVGAGGLTVYDIIESPENAPLAIALAVFDVASGGLSPSKTKKLANQKAGMSQAAKDGMGKNYQKHEIQVRKITGGTCSRKFPKS